MWFSAVQALSQTLKCSDPGTSDPELESHCTDMDLSGGLDASLIGKSAVLTSSLALLELSLNHFALVAGWAPSVWSPTYRYKNRCGIE